MNRWLRLGPRMAVSLTRFLESRKKFWFLERKRHSEMGSTLNVKGSVEGKWENSPVWGKIGRRMNSLL